MKIQTTKQPLSWVIVLLALQFLTPAYAGGEHDSHAHEVVKIHDTEHNDAQHEDDHAHDDRHNHDHNDDHDDDHDDHPKSVTIDAGIALKSGLKTSTVAAGNIAQQVKLYGKTMTDPSQVSHLRARFSGTIQKVNVKIGDQVKAGDILGLVESNESLIKYPIKAMISGMVVERHANPGEVALNQILFTVANYEQLWLELQVFPGQLKTIKAGQKIVLNSGEHHIESRIAHIIPAQGNKPFALARVPLNNETQQLSSGLMLAAQVVVKEFTADRVVKQQAIQIIEDQTVVFIKTADTYTAHPVALGRSDGRYTEVLAGIKAGDTYVYANSYLIKADIEKSGAAHVH